MVDPAFGLLDQRAGDAAPAEIAGEREPDRAGADDEDGGVGLGHGVTIIPSGRVCNRIYSVGGNDGRDVAWRSL